MQLTETYRLTEWIKKEIEEAKIVPKYDNLLNILNQNAKRAADQAAQPFEDQKNDLINTITDVNKNVLTLSQLHMLDVLGIEQNIGKEGKETIEEILSNTLDIAHVATQIEQMKNGVQQGIQKGNELNKVLAPFVEKEPEVSENEILTRVLFEQEASVKDVEQLKDWAAKWHLIGRGFAIASGRFTQEVRVIGGARGSLIVELALLSSIALTLSKAVNLIMDSLVKYQEFKKNAAQARIDKEETPKFSDDFEGDAKRWEERAERLKEDIVIDVVEKVKETIPNYRKDDEKDFQTAVKTLVDFLTKGGDVDCVIPDDVEEEEEQSDEEAAIRKQLKSEFARIRELKETRLLEYAPEGEEEKDDEGEQVS